MASFRVRVFKIQVHICVEYSMTIPNRQLLTLKHYQKGRTRGNYKNTLKNYHEWMETTTNPNMYVHHLQNGHKMSEITHNIQHKYDLKFGKYSSLKISKLLIQSLWNNWQLLWLEKHKALFLKTFNKQIYKNIFSAFSNSNKWNIVIATLLDKFMV